MSRLEEIKKEYIKSLGYDNYQHLINDIKSGRSPIEKLIIIEDDISEKYAEECVKASLDEASEQLINEYPKLASMEIKIKESINNPINIILP